MASTPKMMSSRLMTMKFMQRSAAKEPSTPSNPPPSKRVRLSNGTSSTPATPAPSEQAVVQAALAAEEKKREEALDRAAAKAGETKWVLSFQEPDRSTRGEGLEVREVGFGGIDLLESDEEEESGQGGARMRFGGGVKRKAQKIVKEEESDAESGEASESDSEDSGEDEEDLDSDDPTAELIRETKRDVYAKEREARRVSKESKKERESMRRRSGVDEDMDVSKLSSLSGGGTPKSAVKGKSDMACFACGEKGHMKAQCPNNQGQGRAFSRGGGSRRGRGGLSGRR
ncbi:hypothetical protein BDV96DRAFT_601260 [Lophiotrema nucula]|uniref:CCHC-type domain-containing protein n=1 Tax=Lophiotrema nucula TaxID=690887 RepID=A0A6A5Z3Y4_9PLEO|nr:hypothetical protein BDV96DRAFT_601260 [Lophiotrema nucula]